MPKDELSLFSFEILGLIGREGAGPHDLRQMISRGKIVDWAGESQYYSEPKRLAKLGYLEAGKEPGKTRERTVYHLTEKGLEALRAWAATPAQFTPIKSEALTRMLIADLAGDEATREAIVALRSEIADLRERTVEMREAAEGLPHRRRYLLLGVSLMSGILDAHDEWVDLVERDLSD
jgi:DNA-binding PadR family transcriptional regulator